MGVANIASKGLQMAKSTGFNIGDAIGDAVNVGFAYSDYKGARNEGNSRAVSAAKAVTSFAWGEFYYGGVSKVVGKGIEKLGIKGLAAAGALNMVGTMAITMIPAVIQGVGAAGEHTTQQMGQGYNHRGSFGSGYFNMTEAGYTMRQRSLNAIRSNGLNTQSVLGNEARTYYRGSV